MVRRIEITKHLKPIVDLSSLTSVLSDQTVLAHGILKSCLTGYVMQKMDHYKIDKCKQNTDQCQCLYKYCAKLFSLIFVRFGQQKNVHFMLRQWQGCSHDCFKGGEVCTWVRIEIVWCPIDLQASIWSKSHKLLFWIFLTQSYIKFWRFSFLLRKQFLQFSVSKN